jgi:hypothetical protein
MTDKPPSSYKKDSPYPANTPQYGKFWRLINFDGKTRDEALEIMKTWVPRGKNGFHRKPVAIVEGKKETEKRQATPTTSISPTGPVLDPAPPPPTQLTLEQKQGDRIVTLLVEIARALTRIADHMDPKPGATGTVTLQQRPATSSPQPPRSAENGLVTGCKVKRVSTGELGQVTRIMPGLKEVEVRFMLGTKTLPADQLVEA